MFPSFEALGPAAGGSLNVPPPRYRPLGHVSHVTVTYKDYVRGQGKTDAQRCGLRYEEAVQDHLTGRLEGYKAEPIIRLLDDGTARELRPDGVLRYLDRLFIFEVKFTHVPEAWWQLEKLYKVALARAYHCPISLVEICRSYDPAMPFPVPVTLISDLDEWVSRPRDAFGVFQWRKTTS